MEMLKIGLDSVIRVNDIWACTQVLQTFMDRVSLVVVVWLIFPGLWATIKFCNPQTSNIINND